jgi:hypothetical protein
VLTSSVESIDEFLEGSAIGMKLIGIYPTIAYLSILLSNTAIQTEAFESLRFAVRLQDVQSGCVGADEDDLLVGAAVKHVKQIVKGFEFACDHRQ